MGAEVLEFDAPLVGREVGQGYCLDGIVGRNATMRENTYTHLRRLTSLFYLSAV